MKLVAVTSCPTGIAHSAMAAESLEVAGRAAGHEIEAEVQGAGGIVPLDPARIAEADAVIFAVDASVRDRDRFAHLPFVEVRTRDAIDHGPAIIDRAVAAAAAGAGGAGNGARPTPMAAHAPSGASGAEQFRRWLMTGVSYMLPFVVAGGLLIALGFAVGGAIEVTQVDKAFPSLSDVFSDKVMLGYLFFKIGSIAFGMLVPILAGFIAYGMADRPGLAPGIVAGLIAVQLEAGFLGGLVGGLLAGAVVLLLMRIKVSGPVSKMMPMLVYPFVGTLVTGAIFILVLGGPIADIQSGLNSWLNDLSGTNSVLLGLLLGAMMAFDMGGPVNKAAYAFAIGALASGNTTIIAAVMVAGMTPPLGLALATVVRPKLFDEEEREAGQACWLLGASFITEGAIPFAAADPLRVIPGLMVGSATAGAIALGLDVTLRAPHGGIFVIGLIGNIGGFLLALVIGTAVTAAAVVALKSLRRPAAIDLTDATTAASTGVLAGA